MTRRARRHFAPPGGRHGLGQAARLPCGRRRGVADPCRRDPPPEPVGREPPDPRSRGGARHHAVPPPRARAHPDRAGGAAVRRHLLDEQAARCGLRAHPRQRGRGVRRAARDHHRGLRLAVADAATAEPLRALPRPQHRPHAGGARHRSADARGRRRGAHEGALSGRPDPQAADERADAALRTPRLPRAPRRARLRGGDRPPPPDLPASRVHPGLGGREPGPAPSSASGWTACCTSTTTSACSRGS